MKVHGSGGPDTLPGPAGAAAALDAAAAALDPAGEVSCCVPVSSLGDDGGEPFAVWPVVVLSSHLSGLNSAASGPKQCLAMAMGRAHSIRIVPCRWFGGGVIVIHTEKHTDRTGSAT